MKLLPLLALLWSVVAYCPVHGKEIPISKSDIKAIIRGNSGIFDPSIIEGIVFAESSFRVKVTGDDGLSRGLMQIQLTSAREVGFRGTVQELHDPVINIRYGVKYLEKMFHATGNAYTAIDAYNRGLGNVQKYPYRGQWKRHKHLRKVIIYLERKEGMI